MVAIKTQHSLQKVFIGYGNTGLSLDTKEFYNIHYTCTGFVIFMFCLFLQTSISNGKYISLIKCNLVGRAPTKYWCFKTFIQHKTQGRDNLLFKI